MLQESHLKRLHEKYADYKLISHGSFFKVFKNIFNILKDVESTDSQNRMKLNSFDQVEQFNIKDNLNIKKIKQTAINYTNTNFVKAYGSPDYLKELPITKDQAEKYFEHFLKFKFKNFGPYEDAIFEKEVILYHSHCSCLLNVGLLTPKYVIEKAMKYAKENKVPLNSLEGYIRQIGWREFCHFVYRFWAEN